MPDRAKRTGEEMIASLAGRTDGEARSARARAHFLLAATAAGQGEEAEYDLFRHVEEALRNGEAPEAFREDPRFAAWRGRERFLKLLEDPGR